MRTLAKQLLVSASLLTLVVGVCYGLGYGFYQQKPMRDSDYFTQYIGDKTFCRTVIYYQDQGNADKVKVLLSYAEDNAMGYLMRRFGKDKGLEIVNACETQRQEALLQSCREAPGDLVEMLVLEHNKPAVKKKGLI
ncbi:hypothetical protein SAMN04488540_102141 [Ferrimonas sediminum]|uniref:Uncharacterized protein n=1 Tax=Ferrimonas sediminum TaxID=718193 RepID=A0A1G8LQQ1_9GAMM|nr:hypothetical protein [Ferrimonas sediminum]SDI58014.1 hypothetical protein SAMN04488540_102141 [Ferrimonas sediminum]